REAFAHAEPRLLAGQDVVLVARPTARELVDREGLVRVEASLTELIEKAGLLDTGPAAADGEAGGVGAVAEGETAREVDAVADGESAGEADGEADGVAGDAGAEAGGRGPGRKRAGGRPAGAPAPRAR